MVLDGRLSGRVGRCRNPLASQPRVCLYGERGAVVFLPVAAGLSGPGVALDWCRCGACVTGTEKPPKSGENRSPSHNRRSNYFAARAAAFA